MAMLDKLCHDIPEAARRIAARFWPGPLTMALPKRPIVPDAVTAGLSTVGVRYPSHPVAQMLIRAAGVPIAAPSANRSGKPSPTTFAHVLEDMDGRIDGIIDGGSSDVGVESTFIEFVGGKVRILRPGYITPEDLAEIVGAENVEIDGAVRQGLAENERPRSPGMKYRHYAPSAPVVAVLGENWDCAAKYAEAYAHRKDRRRLFVTNTRTGFRVKPCASVPMATMPRRRTGSLRRCVSWIARMCG